MTHFSTREVAKLAILPAARIRSCVRAGVLVPRRGRGGQLEWSFQDLLLLKTTKGLLDARVPLARIRRMVASLKRQLPDDQALSSLTIFADGRRVVAWDGTARWQPDSGQFLFTFDVQAVAAKIDLPERPPEPPLPEVKEPTRTAEQWFDLGCELDAATGTISLLPGKPATIAFLLSDDQAEAVRIVVRDPVTDAELYRSPTDIPVRLGVG